MNGRKDCLGRLLKVCGRKKWDKRYISKRSRLLAKRMIGVRMAFASKLTLLKKVNREPVVSEGVFTGITKAYPYEDHCCFIAVQDFENPDESGCDITEMFVFEKGKKYRIIAQEID